MNPFVCGSRRRPGSILEWQEEGNEIVAERAGRFSFEDIHRKLFFLGKRFKERIRKGEPLEMKEAIDWDVRERHAHD
jgi:hypothetical protein